MRQPNSNVKLSFTAKPSADIWTETFECELLTPMVGGGIKSWEIDREKPIRESEIKSQLRFWWRAAQQPPIARQDMLNRESAIFGATGVASDVEIVVNQDAVAEDDNFPLIEYRDRNPAWRDILPPYGLFPLTLFDEPSIRVLLKHRFALKVTASRQHEAEVKRALHLWLIFGGVGCRTRRGFGSVCCKKMPMSTESLIDLKTLINSSHIATPPSATEFPNLHGCRLAADLVDEKRYTAHGTWTRLITTFGEIRQGPGRGRNPIHQETRRPGRSFWPEADSIRNNDRIATTHPTYRHRVSHPAVDQTANVGFYPRAAYGMPLRVEFRGERTDPQSPFQVLPKGRERWPSPVILKVSRLSNGSLIRLCLVLNCKLPELELKKDKAHAKDLDPNESPGNPAKKTLTTRTRMTDPYDFVLQELLPGRRLL